MIEKGELASLSPLVLDQVVSAIIDRLGLQNMGDLPSKQGVAGSSPVSRSNILPKVLAACCSLPQND